MKVAMVLPYLPPKIGGKELWIKWMTPELLKRGIDIAIFASNVQDYHKYKRKFETKEWKFKGVKKTVKVYLANTLYNNDKYSTPFLIPPFLSLWREDPDIIHLHEPNVFLTTSLGLFGKLFLRKKIALHCHSDAFKWRTMPFYLRPAITLYNLIYLLKLKMSDVIIAVSKEYVQSSRYLSKFRKKTSILPMAVAPPFNILSEDEIKKVKKRYGIPLDKDIVLYVGRIDPRKGVNYLVEAVNRLASPYLIFVGSGDDKSRGELEEQVKDLGMQARVKFMPTLSQDKLNLFYNACDVLCLPTNETETFGVVLIESWSVKKPVVVTDTGAPTSMVNKSKGGLVAKRMDAKDIAEKINIILSNKKLASAMGENGYKFAKGFTYSNLSERLIEIYRSINKDA